jgi:hypothetical protein
MRFIVVSAVRPNDHDRLLSGDSGVLVRCRCPVEDRPSQRLHRLRGQSHRFCIHCSGGRHGPFTPPRARARVHKAIGQIVAPARPRRQIDDCDGTTAALRAGGWARKTGNPSDAVTRRSNTAACRAEAEALREIGADGIWNHLHPHGKAFCRFKTTRSTMPAADRAGSVVSRRRESAVLYER